MKTVRIKIRGKVQGVFYRKYTFDKASKLGLTGYVSNLPDGQVIIEATGETDALEDLIMWCRHGSPGSDVEEVEVAALPITNYSGFSIRY